MENRKREEKVERRMKKRENWVQNNEELNWEIIEKYERMGEIGKNGRVLKEEEWRSEKGEDYLRMKTRTRLS